MKSLTTRVAVGAGIVLAVFIALSALALERAFSESARAVRQERLLAQVYLLMAAAEVDTQGKLTLGSGAMEPSLDLPGSGLYAAVLDGAGEVIWRSRSHLSINGPPHASIPDGTRAFEEHVAGGVRYLRQSYGIRWKVGDSAFPFTFSVAEDMKPLARQLTTFRHSLFQWLGGMAALLLIAQWALLRWGLRPLRRVAQEIRQLQGGDRDRLEGDYPSELTLLTENLNALMLRERAQQKRYRDALADLAHSLKTPLALIRGASRSPDATLQHTLEEQVDRMDKIVGYHLQRASTAGRSALAAAVPLRLNAERVLQAVVKVYAEKNIDADPNIDPRLRFRGDEGDLMEILGNLIDNACKWCRSTVRVSAQYANGQITLRVEDDGPGIPEADIARILERGVRLDQNTPGQGIGLAVTHDIVSAYAGRLTLTRAAMGGACIAVTLPGSLAP